MIRARRHGPVAIEANLTPMIDMTFLLIVFFVLVSRIVESESAEMDLPILPDPRSAAPEEEQRVVINVVPGSGGTVEEYRVGAATFPSGSLGMESLQRHLAGLLRVRPDAILNVRADRDTRYEHVEPVMDAIARASGQAGGDARPQVNLMIIREEER